MNTIDVLDFLRCYFIGIGALFFILSAVICFIIADIDEDEEMIVFKYTLIFLYFSCIILGFISNYKSYKYSFEDSSNQKRLKMVNKAIYYPKLKDKEKYYIEKIELLKKGTTEE